MTRTTVFLDWGGTLARVSEEQENPVTVWGRVLDAFGESRAPDQIRRAWVTAHEAVGSQIYSYLGRTDAFWSLYDAHLMDALGLARRRTEIEAAVQRVYEDPSAVHLYPESRSTLVALRDRGYRTGLLSNHHDGLLRDVRYHQLEPLFDTITYSQEAGAEKPDPAVFSLALQRARCAPGDAVHVGDRLDADVDGAHRSGLIAVWLDRQRTGRSVDCPTIHTLDELPSVLATFDGSGGLGGPGHRGR